MHVYDGIFRTEPQKIRNNKGSLFRSENLRTDSAALWRKEAKPYLVDLRATAPELKKFLQVAGPAGNVSSNGGVDRDFRSGNIFENSLIGCRFTPLIMVGLKSVDRDNYVQ